MHRTFLFLVIFLFNCSAAGQNPVRENRVWALKLNIEYCGVVPVAARSTIWDYEDGAGELSPINANTSIYQWSWIKDPEILDNNYTAMDIISEMADNKIYLLQIIARIVGSGTPTTDDIFIELNYWISPVGINTQPIKPVPLRQFVDGVWNADDQKLLVNWFIDNHRFSNSKIWRDVSKLSYKFDARTTIEINIGNGSCIEM